MVRNTGEENHNRLDMLKTLTDDGFQYGKDYIVMDVPNIVDITYGRDVGYPISEERFDKDIEDVSATKIRNSLPK